MQTKTISRLFVQQMKARSVIKIYGNTAKNGEQREM